jgi:hypothetical protein
MIEQVASLRYETSFGNITFSQRNDEPITVYIFAKECYGIKAEDLLAALQAGLTEFKEAK